MERRVVGHGVVDITVKGHSIYSRLTSVPSASLIIFKVGSDGGLLCRFRNPGTWKVARDRLSFGGVLDAVAG